MLLPIETKFDSENNVLYAETDQTGTYCVIDMEKWFADLGITPTAASSKTSSLKLKEAKFLTAVGCSLSRIIRIMRKARAHGKNGIHKNAAFNKKNTSDYIRTALNCNFPVAMLIGLNPKLKNIEVTFPKNHCTKDSLEKHWVTITEMKVDNISQKTLRYQLGVDILILTLMTMLMARNYMRL